MMPGGSNAGRGYVYFGGSSMNNTADVILSGAAANDQFGTSVSFAGDFNGDGFSDVIVGANLNDAGGSSAGRAYIYYGGSIMNNIVDLTLTGEAASDQFRHCSRNAGDKLATVMVM
ncbi:MAG: FG-GAP repeat protein [Ignavibacteria bacterium]|nr:FG-GAP repeat protein [Ignavibacteria bacterium]